MRAVIVAHAPILLVLYLTACSQHVAPRYVTPEGVTPQQYIATRHPKQVRLTLADSSSHLLSQPWVARDTIGGLIDVDTWNPGTRWAVPVGSVRRLEVPQASGEFVEAQVSRPGQRVRVTAPAEGLAKQEGTFEGLQGDSALMVSIEGESLVVPLAAVTKLEYVNGHRHHAAVGLGLGAAFGAVAGGLAGYAAGEDQCGSCSGWGCICVTKGDGAGLGAAGGALVGGLMGLVMGGFSATDRWEEVPLDRLPIARATGSENGRRHD